MKWILIAILSGAWGVSMDMQEFDDEASCRFTGGQIAKLEVANEAQIQYACVPKGAIDEPTNDR